MPRAPQYQGDSVPPAPIPGLRMSHDAPDAAFGGGRVGAQPFAAAGGLAGQVAEIQAREIEMADQLAVQEAENALSARENAMLYDPQKGAFTRRGKDSFSLPGDIDAEYGKTVGDIERGLKNQRQKLAFRQRADSRRQNVGRSIMQHVAAERIRYDDETTRAGVENEVNSAILSAGDRPTVERSIGKVMGILVQHAERTGKPKEWLDAQMAEQTSRIHAGTISNLLSKGDDLAAKAYLDEYRGELNARDLEGVSKSVEQGSYIGESQRREDAIFLAAKSEREALEQARKIEDPRLRDMTLARLERRYYDQRRLADQEYNEMFHGAVDAVAQASGARTVEEAVGAVAWSKMRAAQRSELSKLFKYSRDGAPTETDPKAYTDLYAMSPDELASMTQQQFMAKFAPALSATDYKQAVQLWSDSREAVRNPKGGAVVQGVISDQDMILEALQESGLGGITRTDTSETLKKDERKAEAFRRFRVQVNGAILSLGAQKKGPVSDQEKLEIIDRIRLREAKALTIKRFDMGFDALDSDFTRRLGELTEAELEGEVIEMPWAVRESFYNLALSKGLVSPGTPFKVWEDANRGRVNRAFVASLREESDERISEILGGR